MYSKKMIIIIKYMYIAPSLSEINVIETSFEAPNVIRLEFDKYLQGLLQFVPSEFENVGIMEEDEFGK